MLDDFEQPPGGTIRNACTLFPPANGAHTHVECLREQGLREAETVAQFTDARGPVGRRRTHGDVSDRSAMAPRGTECARLDAHGFSHAPHQQLSKIPAGRGHSCAISS